MELPDQVKKSIEEQKKQCPFCKIAKGEIQAKTVYEDEHIIAFLDINPASKGHCILMPREHYPILPYMDREDFERLFGIAGEFAEAVQKATIADKVQLFIASGYAAGQMSNHFLIHVIPRNKADGLDMLNATGTTTQDAESLQTIGRNILAMAESYFKRNPASWHKPREAPAQVRTFTKEQVIKIVENNPQLKEAIIKTPDAIKQQIDSNEQLKQLFSTISINDIIEHFRAEAGTLSTVAQEAAETDDAGDVVDDTTRDAPADRRSDEQAAPQSLEDASSRQSPPDDDSEEDLTDDTHPDDKPRSKEEVNLDDIADLF
ncbi:hypothetical protein COY28_06840 [Candidatus Woesearchaeota archaeon CG_4_10_14_0_2_um_filter_57_5]|nr:MAG: hypothetical protein AUJ68_03850 [Candidatus Woesearchaeota archaeon CG1_02_57_44]PIN69892.1 MAG: hypothetical protein COV94_02345 [Candidatus Woesearchaeota archaeon CG11_big_fil_rev_8_21_14_0_20_57_5]PIZ48865.1 MAG: hypothetical protein COY28_06840 [Candidatus Woesearchaeota archaeon CG_4_10_14_0_2_um_filter_57_5]